MVVGLYDIDLLHAASAWPNLELMKVYNYFNQNGDSVILMKKKEDEGRYNQIIYFKDNKNITIPRNVNVIGKNKKVYGEGFFNKKSTLPQPYCDVPPNPMIYLNVFDKYKKLNWNNFSANSIIRLSNQDFTGYKTAAPRIYIVDRDFCQLEGAEDFLQEYKNKDFYFFHTLEIRSEEEFNRFMRYTLILSKPLYINFKFSKDFFIENIKEKLHFNLYYPQEGEKDFLLRVTKVILLSKYYNKKIIYNLNYARDPLIKNILLWSNKDNVSYQNFYKGNKEALSLMEKASTEVRLLLKTNPLTLNTNLIDF